jgi:hypothetical protein
MHRTNGDSYGTALNAHGVSVHVYRDSVPAVSAATQARHLEANAWQEEIANVIEAEGYALNTDAEVPAQMVQLNDAINNKLEASRIYNDSTTTGNYVDDALENIDARIDLLDTDDIADLRISPSDLSTTLDNIDTRCGNIESYTIGLDGRLDTLEGQTLDARLDVLEGQTLDARLDVLEGQNLDSRLDEYDNDKVNVTGLFTLVGYAGTPTVNFFAIIQRHRNITNTNVLTEVLLYLPEYQGDSTAAYLQIASASIPAALRPAATYNTQRAPCMVYDDFGGAGSIYNGSLWVLDTGDWFFSKYDHTPFAYGSAQQKGISAQIIRYIISIA